MRNQLISEVRENNFLLHGSPKNITEIIPQMTDGEMAICATPYPEIAIFMAVVGTCKKGRFGYSITRKKDSNLLTLTFTMCKEKVDTLLNTNLSGFVYTLDNKPFKKVDLVEYRTYEPIYAGKKFEVKLKNLPFILLDDVYTYKTFIEPFYEKN